MANKYLCEGILSLDTNTRAVRVGERFISPGLVFEIKVHHRWTAVKLQGDALQEQRLVELDEKGLPSGCGPHVMHALGCRARF